MNKLITDIEGRFPIVLDDFRWMLNGMTEALAQLAKGFGDKLILWGVEVDGDKLTPGAMFVDGEIFLFDDDTSSATPEFNLQVITDYNPDGLKTFPDRADGDNLKNTYAVRKLGLAPYEYIGSAYNLNSFFRLSDFNDNSAAIAAVDAKISGITETLAITDNLGNDKLRLDVENGLIKNKWYSVEASGGLPQSVTLYNIGDSVVIDVSYYKGSEGAELATLSLSDNVSFSLSQNSVTEGITQITITRDEISTGIPILELIENGIILASCEILEQP